MDRKSSQNKSVATESVGKRQKLPKLSVFRLFRFATLPEIAMILCATIFSIAAGVLLPMSITVFGDLLKNVTVSDMTNLVSFMLPKVKKILCLATGLFIASYASNCLWILTGASQAHRIRSKYLHAALRQEIAWFDTAEEGSLNTRLATDTQLIQDGISENFGQAIAMIAQFIGGFAVAFTRDTKLSAVMVVLLPSVALTGGAVGMLIQRYTTRYQDAQANAASIAEQVFGNIRTVYSLSMESQFLQRYADALCISKAIGIKKGASLGFGVGLVFCMINFNFALGVWYGYLRVRQGIIAGVDVPTVLFAMMVGAMALLQIPPLITAVSGATGAAHRIYALIDRNPEIDSDSDAGVVPQKATGKIKFKQVNFYYPSRPQQHVLKNFDLEIRPGMTVALVGSSGSGKSTAIQLLQRFYDP
ncbi:ATP-binding cassette, sub-B (MDR TAP), member 4, partial [Apophysomyces sp. BC1021]